MAKRDRVNGGTDEKKGGGAMTALVVALIIIIWIAIFALLVNLDVGGIGTALRPMLKNVPLVNKILPPVSDEELAWENDLAYKDIIEANQRIKELEILVDKLTIESEDKDDEIAALLVQEIDRLKGIFINDIKRACPVGRTRIVAQVEVVILGEMLANVIQDSQSAVTAVKNTNQISLQFIVYS